MSHEVISDNHVAVPSQRTGPGAADLTDSDGPSVIGAPNGTDVTSGPPHLDAPDGDVRRLGRAPQWLLDYQARIVITDILIVAAVVAASIQLRWGAETADLAVGVSWATGTWISLFIVALWTIVLAVNGAWDKRTLGVGTAEYRRIFTASCAVFFLLVTGSYLLRADLARGYVAIVIPLGLAALMLGRFAARAHLRLQRRSGRSLSRVLIIGSEASAGELAAALRRAPEEGLSVAGICVPRAQQADRDDRRSAGHSVSADDTNGLQSVIKETRANVVAVAPSPHFGSGQVRQLAWSLEGTGIRLVLAPALTDVAGPRVSIKPVSGLPLLYVDEPRFRGPRLVVKTALDLVTAVVAVVLASPIMVVVAVLIKREDGGPVFFRQPRVGLDGREFNVMKFRSMRPNADKAIAQTRADTGQEDAVFYKSASDARVTRIGRILRKTSLDELPQLFNVIAGSMSLVGPRPLVPGEGAGVTNFVERRMLVKPGLTGLWQVSGRSDASIEERIRLDLYYVENWSVAGDIGIMFRTLREVARGTGAY